MSNAGPFTEKVSSRHKYARPPQLLRLCTGAPRYIESETLEGDNQWEVEENGNAVKVGYLCLCARCDFGAYHDRLHQNSLA